MQKEILLQLLEQSKKDSDTFLNKINTENASFRLTAATASVGFIYRHIGETIHLLAQSFGYPTDVEGSTMGQSDSGKEYDLETSRNLFEQGYATLEKIVNETSEEEWLAAVETHWFGKISRIKLFSITLFHTAHHCGQISSAILKGKVV
ncbi:DinB family protein [Flavobacterium sp.]|uniref:DinB family protein n=1 Tax=Flavobacterium sp. TaxID=239 RepID=UPI003D6BAA92